MDPKMMMRPGMMPPPVHMQQQNQNFYDPSYYHYYQYYYDPSYYSYYNQYYQIVTMLGPLVPPKNPLLPKNSNNTNAHSSNSHQNPSHTSNNNVINNNAQMPPRQPQPPPPPGGDVTNCRSLYVGNISDKVTEGLLYDIFASIGAIESCKLIKDKVTGQSAGYGFIDYYDHHAANMALQQFNGRTIHGHELKVNWAVQNTGKEDTSTHFHIFVGDLSPEIDDKALHTAFAPFGSISDARVMWDQNSGRSRGYGFVAYRKKEDAQRALTEMNGEWLGSRAIRCNWANQKGGPGVDQEHRMMGGGGGNGLDYATVVTQSSPSNVTVYIGNIPTDITEQNIRTIFSEYGVISEIKIQLGQGFAFVRYNLHESAAKAICGGHGRIVGGKSIKCSWGKERGTEAPFF